MVGLTGKCRRGSALDKPDFFLGLPKAVLSPDRKGGWKIWKPGCPRKTGPARADSSSLQPTSWPRQVTSKKSTGSLFYCFTPRNLECHRWLCFDRNLLHTQIYKISESKFLKQQVPLFFLLRACVFYLVFRAPHCRTSISWSQNLGRERRSAEFLSEQHHTAGPALEFNLRTRKFKIESTKFKIENRKFKNVNWNFTPGKKNPNSTTLLYDFFFWKIWQRYEYYKNHLFLFVVTLFS